MKYSIGDFFTHRDNKLKKKETSISLQFILWSWVREDVLKKTLLTTWLTYLLFCISASLRANNHLRMTKAHIEEKLGDGWSKVGTDNTDYAKDDAEDDKDDDEDDE